MPDHRVVNTADESAYSEISSQYLIATELEPLPDSTILSRSLSLKSVISTRSSFARRSQAARIRPELQDVNQIGDGLQGVIFEQVGRPLVFKKEIPGNETRSSNLRHEYGLHEEVSTAFALYDSKIHSHVRVPKPLEFISRADDAHRFWDVLPKVPAQYRARGDVVKMERILPLPKVARKALVAHFYGKQGDSSTADIEAILNETTNKHCLVRLYLGKADGPLAQGKSPLRNFPLYLKAMEKLSMDVNGLANAMGKAFAIMHWGAGINGDDVEFVLGTSAIGTETIPPDLQHRAVGMYLLDFGQCDVVDLKQEPDEVYQAFKGAMVTGDNQNFIPNCQKSPSVFAEFKDGYLLAGKTILEEKGMADRLSVEDFMREYEEYAEDFL
ncbi:hypothetical protein N7474_005486 [Penicillium riverlandense]|uniref:uncharacterized protein n=1 Tax=Penicillium riverlandense TaxID=1903569 RepID=UPI0025465BBF|nr:uncharacterized protein N7474_005486 [Penicillium riverlandense]KAJ5819895.1 hypothetical protein N7474_005486 [Penicillium riverlandense]